MNFLFNQESVDNEKEISSLTHPRLYIEEFQPYQDSMYTECFTSDNIQLANSFVNKYKLKKPLYSDQITDRLNIDIKHRFDQLFIYYSLIIDYVDMVHDITKCLDYFKDFLKQEYINEISRIIKEMCGKSFGAINVKSSHSIQKRYLTKYIEELRSLGFLLPNIQDPLNVTEENAINTLSGIQNCGRESGRYINTFIEYIKTSQKNNPSIKVPSIKAIPNNALGAIDGCLGECVLDKEIT